MFETIVALATAPFTSAISMIRVSGDKALEIVSHCFSKNIENCEKRTIYYGFIMDQKEKVDEVILNVYPGTHSYTGENLVEIQCHGSMLIVREIIALLIKNGARNAERGEFTARAFYHGRIDLVQAEAINDMIHASSKEGKDLALLSLEGKTSQTLTPLKTRLADLLSQIEVNIDYPEYQDIEEVTTQKVLDEVNQMCFMIDHLIQDGRQGKLIKDGIKVAIVGKPNVGKSSLLNALMKEQKAIVTDIAGTTRDIVEGEILLEGLPLHLLDTAGIHESKDEVESIGIEKAKKAVEDADVVLLVIDGSKEEDKEDIELREKTKNKKRIIIYNKEDLLKDEKKKDGIYISAKDENIEELKDAILSLLELDQEVYHRPSFANERQLGLLEKTKIELKKAQSDAANGLTLDLVAVSIQEAYLNILSILGEGKGNDFTEEIFSRFCVGK